MKCLRALTKFDRAASFLQLCRLDDAINMFYVYERYGLLDSRLRFASYSVMKHTFFFNFSGAKRAQSEKER